MEKCSTMNIRHLRTNTELSKEMTNVHTVNALDDHSVPLIRNGSKCETKHMFLLFQPFTSYVPTFDLCFLYSYEV